MSGVPQWLTTTRRRRHEGDNKETIKETIKTTIKEKIKETMKTTIKGTMKETIKNKETEAVLGTSQDTNLYNTLREAFQNKKIYI